MPEPLIRLLSLGVLVLVYLFFLRVLRALWRQTQPPGGPARREPKEQPASHPMLEVVSPRRKKGIKHPITEEMTIGRAAGCSITVDDNYASQIHARIFRNGGTILVEDLGSTNGTYLNGQRVDGPTVVSAGDHLTVGSITFEVST